MTNLKDLAREEAALKALLDRVNSRLKAVRGLTQEALDAAEQATGTRQIAASLADGTTVGTISLTSPAKKPEITDEDAFLAWVKKTFPGEVERRFVTTVREAFVSKVLAEMQDAGEARVVDPATGEIHEGVPGVEMRAGTRTHSLRFKAGGRDAVAAAWHSGDLVLPGVTGPAAVEGGDR